MTSNEKLVSAKESAEIYGCSRSTWWRWLAENRIPAPIKIGGLTRWRLSELQQHLDTLSDEIAQTN